MNGIITTVVVALFIVGCSKPTTRESNVSTKIQYLEKRKALLSQNKQMAISHGVEFTEEEKSAEEKILKLRDKLLQYYDSTGYHPAKVDFFKSKEHIESTDLYAALKKMPKGGFLHMHASALKNFNWVIEKAISLPEVYVYWADDDEKYIKGQLSAFAGEDVPDGFVKAAQLAGDHAGFQEEMYDLLTLKEETDRDTMKIWNEFDRIFARLGFFYIYQPVFYDWHKAIFEGLIQDNIQHVELRQIMFDGLYDLEHGFGHYNEDSIIHIFKDLEKELQQSHPNFSLKIIYTDVRFRSKEDIDKSFIRAFELRKKYPDMIKGFDLVAHEDAGNTTLYYLDTWLKADSLSKVYSVDMPLYFHDGESNSPQVENLIDAILLGSRRIGHGFNLNLFPALKETIRNESIGMEVNPISNQVLGYLEDLRVHPANGWIREGIPITISSDDPSIFLYEGLTFDYWMATIAWELDLSYLKQISKNGILLSSLNEEEQKKSLTYWEDSWNEFISYINQTY